MNLGVIKRHQLKNRWAKEINEAMVEIARLKDITPEDEGIDIGLGEEQ